LESFGIDVPGIKQVVFGIILLLVVVAMPDGVWPWLARKLGLAERQK
jgi:branched-chain amino acid transport system permease protein